MRTIDCPDCEGSGQMDNFCPTCGDEGCLGGNPFMLCPDCSENCQKCEGTGSIENHEDEEE